jgi:PIN domain nuclease of toxin-antitoxin system
MMYLLDTVAIIRHFTGNKNLGKKAKIILDSIEYSDNILAVSVISLMEIMYLSQRNRININVESVIELMADNTSYKIIELNTEIVTTASSIDFYELHDRMILATAKWLDIPILSSDKRFSDVKGIVVIWD